MTATAVALLLACAAFLVERLSSFRTTSWKTSSCSADTLAAASTASTSFDDKAAAETKRSPRSRPAKRWSSAHTSTTPAAGSLRSYTRAPRQREPPLPVTSASVSVTWRPHRRVPADLVLDEESIGTCTSKPIATSSTRACGTSAANVVLGSFGPLLLAFYIASRLQRMISGPILRLAEAARMVSAEKNYAMRVDAGTATTKSARWSTGFNEMLEQIQERDEQLQRHQAHLEEEVAARTLELTTTNSEPARPPRTRRKKGAARRASSWRT